MFYTQVAVETPISNNLEVNAVNGTIVKNYRKSFIKRFHLQSKLADTIFDEKRQYIKIHRNSYSVPEEKEVVVIQLMMCGDMEVIAELMWKEDFDKLFEAETEEQ